MDCIHSMMASSFDSCEPSRKKFVTSSRLVDNLRANVPSADSAHEMRAGRCNLAMQLHSGQPFEFSSNGTPEAHTMV